MPRSTPNKGITEKFPTLVLLSRSASSGDIIDFNLIDGSIRYFETVLRNAFNFVMIDNIGTGRIRFSINRPHLEISDFRDGAKTLRAGDYFYVEEEVWHIRIYFIENSTVEIVLKSDKQY